MCHHSVPVQQDQTTVNGQTCHDYAALLDHQVQCKGHVILLSISISFLISLKVGGKTVMNTYFYVVLWAHLVAGE